MNKLTEEKLGGVERTTWLFPLVLENTISLLKVQTYVVSLLDVAGEKGLQEQFSWPESS